MEVDYLESITETGNTYESALTKALMNLKLTKEQVNIEILDNGSKGFLGIGYSPVKIRVTKKVENNQGSTISKEEKNDKNKHTGLIGIKNGQVIKFGDFNHHLPQLIPCQHTSFFINGVQMDHAVEVNELDEIDIQVDQVVEPTEWEIRLNKAETEAYLYFSPGYQIIRRLTDQPLMHKLTLKLQENREEKQTVTAEDIITYVREIGIKDVQIDVIHNVLLEQHPVEVMIAKGKEPVPGKDGGFEYYINMEDIYAPPLELPDGTFDFRETRRIPYVEEGQSITKVLQPTKGEPGLTVKGERIPQIEGVALTIKASPNIYMDKNGEIKSLIEGRPKIEIVKHTAKVDVVTMLVHKGDLNLSHGNLRFNGDIEITGQVEDGMEVQAKGEITIHGSINHSRILAAQSVLITKNVISSFVHAGLNDVMIMKLQPLLTTIESQMEVLVNGIQQLSSKINRQSKPVTAPSIKMFIRILLEKKLMELAPNINEFTKIVESENITDHDLNMLCQKLYHLISFHSTEMSTMEEMEHLRTDIKKYTELKSEDGNPSINVRCAYAIQSNIYSDGDIFLLGKGCYNSSLQAKGNIHISGYVRGGTIRAAKSIKIREVGSYTGVKTLLVVDKDGFIELQQVYENVTIQIGKQVYTFYEGKKHIYAFLDESGQISLHKKS